MNELHALAARMGSLPVSQRRAALREDAPIHLRSDEASRRTGDWPQAMANLPDLLAN